MPIAGYIITIVIGYLLGSIPTGFLVAKARGIDIRTLGSGNIGATNVFRILGTPAGVFVLFADALKGWLAVGAAECLSHWLAPSSGAAPREWMAICGGVAAVLGHNYTCWLHFKGGKGIATSAGVLLALVQWALLIILSIWVLVFAFSRYVSLASICASAALPLATWLTTGSPRLTIVTGLMAVLAIYKHKSNIQRLLNGTENRLTPKKKPATNPNQSS